jgi:acetyl esterase/lipase
VSPAKGGRVGGDAGERRRPVRVRTTSVGEGARAVTILRPAGATEPLPAVIFLHGWGETRVSDYGGWLRHLAREGSAVIFPRYQRDESSRPDRALESAVAGIRAALRKEVKIAPESVVVAGHSAGGALAADYAAAARREGLPPAQAVLAVYPGRAILGYPGGIPAVDPDRIPRSTRIVALAGDADAVVGTEPARALVESASRVPRSRRRLVIVRNDAVDDHYAAERTGRAARQTFWRRLDRLIARARQFPQGP